MSVLDADKHPSETARAGFDDVPGVESVNDGFDAERSALVFWCVAAVACSGRHQWVGRHVFGAVGFPGVGEDVQDGEAGHFDAEEHGGNADFDVLIGEVVGWLEGSIV